MLNYLTNVPLLTLLILVAAACGSGSRWRWHPGESSPSVYEAQAEVSATMQELARSVDELDGIMRGQGGIDAGRHELVVMLLLEVQSLATRLAEEGPSEHPLLEAYLPVFRSDVRRALEAVAWDPPNYYFAGTLSGACVYCHSRPL